MAEIILHQYPQSPFAEKVRLMLGFKGLPWRAVDIPRWMPKPDLLPLTGGYRKTPVMQIGADVYCDSACIAKELDRRFPSIPLFPEGTAGLARTLGAWIDRVLFFDVVGVVFGTHGDAAPKELKEDRLKFSDGMIDIARYKDDQAHLRAQTRAHLFWLEHTLDDGRLYLLGPKPTYADFCAYGPVWMLVNRVPELGFLADTPRLRGWVERMAAVGHGMFRPMDAREALAVAHAAQPGEPMMEHPESPVGLERGTRVAVSADDYGKDPVQGYLVGLSSQRIIIRRGDPAVGEVNVHFPRPGFRIVPA